MITSLRREIVQNWKGKNLMKNPMSVVGRVSTYTTLKECSDLARDESWSNIKRCIGSILVFGLLAWLYIPTSIVGILSLGITMISLVFLYVELVERFIQGYYLDASFTLAPIDPKYPNGFRYITAQEFRIFPNGENTLTPPANDVRLLIPLSGINENKGYCIVGSPGYKQVIEFTGRCTECTDNEVLVTIGFGNDRVTLNLDQIVAIATRHNPYLSSVVGAIGKLYADSLATNERDVVRYRAMNALQLFRDLDTPPEKQIPMNTIKSNLQEIISITDARNTVQGSVRKTED